MRLFFAIDLPRQVQAELGALRPTEDGRDYRWVDPALMHVTLAFLGEQPPDRLPLLEEVAGAVAAHSQHGVLRLGLAGSFGSQKAPRVLWVGVDGDLGRLTALQSALVKGLRHAGLVLEDTPYRPHITLARRRASARGGAPPGWPPDHLGRTAFPMDQLTLFESRLSPRGASYIPRFQTSLTSN